MQALLLESRINLAIEAKRTTPRLSIRKLAKQFDIPRTTLQYRMTGRTSKADKANGIPILTPSEEEAIVQYISQMDSRGFSPRRSYVQDMADLLMAKRGTRHVGKCWTDRFIIRRPELCTRFSRAYVY
jgi:hypothetical protein